MEAKIKDAVDTNVRGLSELLDLCHEMRYLKSMVFVSTAYSNCSQYVIEERFYDAPIQATTLMKLTDEVEEIVLDNITPQLIDKWPNTYCYSKAIAENMFYNNTGKLPVGVFRPSIVMPTYSDPVPGWTANMYGPVGIMLVTGLGILRVFNCEPHKKFDFVPADLCVNALICTAWEIHQKRQNNRKPLQEEIPVYNYSAGPNRNLTWTQLMEYSDAYEYPLKNALWITSLILTNNPLYYNFLWLFLHIIPAYFIDTYLFMTGQKPKLIKTYDKITRFTNVFYFFTIREWDIVNQNVYSLWNRLNETDRKLFPFDMDVVDYKKFILDACLGIKLYVLKENLDNAQAEKKRYQRLLKMHKTVKTCFVLFVGWSIYKFTSLGFALLSYN